jgi:L-amino acid N-acyltransferase YncA
MIAQVRPACDPVALRGARPEDCEAIWRWNSAPATPARSRRAELVAFVEHERWFARRLADGDAPIWVVEAVIEAPTEAPIEAAIEAVTGTDHRPVGMVRLDRPTAIERGRARISIALAAQARGRGIDRAAIAAACRAWHRPVAAEIFASDREGRACFEACGFRAVAVEAGLLIYHWDPET